MRPNTKHVEKLQQNINYQFKDIALLKLALTHRSASKNNNERLEFLGDSVLGVVISYELYRRFPHIDEGKLSRLRSFLVKGETLSQISAELGLSEAFILGKGELKSAGSGRRSIHADVLEAIFGAVFLEAGFKRVSQVILGLYQTLLADINLDDSLKDAKTQLQEYLQKHNQKLPKYELTKTQGRDHNAVFTVNCFLVEQKIQITQKAKSIKKAEQNCAQVLLERLKAL